MKENNDPLGPFPALRSLRDDLLVRDAEARAAGAELVTRILFAATLNLRLPPDRLIRTEDAARLIGVEPEDFEELAYERSVKPVRYMAKHTYWRVSDVYALGG